MVIHRRNVLNLHLNFQLCRTIFHNKTNFIHNPENRRYTMGLFIHDLHSNFCGTFHIKALIWNSMKTRNFPVLFKFGFNSSTHNY